MWKNTPSKRVLTRLNSVENHLPNVSPSTQSISIQTNPIEKSSQTTNTPNYFNEMLDEGKHFTDEQFEKFIKGN